MTLISTLIAGACIPGDPSTDCSPENLIDRSGDLGTFNAPSAAWASSLTGESAASVVERLASVALGAATLAAAVYFLFSFVIAAWRWMASGGDSGKVEKARDTMTNSIIGLMLVVASYAIIGIVGSLFGIDILNFGQEIIKLAPTN